MEINKIIKTIYNNDVNDLDKKLQKIYNEADYTGYRILSVARGFSHPLGLYIKVEMEKING